MKRILEYFEGTPDTVYDTDKKINWRWDDKNTVCFGFFPISLDNDYEFFMEHSNHFMIANKAARKLAGKAYDSLSPDYRVLLLNQCYNKAYCLGRLWEFNNDKYPNIISFWRLPSSKMASAIAMKLGIDPSKYILVTEQVQKGNEANIMLSDYIASDFSGDDGAKERNTPINIDQKIADMIRSYNKPNETWQSLKNKEGWKTLAQRNATIYQENKQLNKVNKIKMENKKYQEEFSNYLKIMNEALNRNDFKAYDVVKGMLDECINDCKHERALIKEMDTSNFGILNHIFENELPTLLKKNKKAVKNVIKTIKEDKNLMGEFNFYNVIKNQYTEGVSEIMNPEVVIEHVMEAIDIDQKTLNESNNKLRRVMVENGIVPSDFVSAEDKKLYENGNAILSLKKSPNNVIRLAESYKSVGEYMDAHKKEKASLRTFDTLIEEFENKMKETLNESEISFVQQITDFRSPIAEQRKEKLFNNFKNECISKIDEMLKEDSSNEELNGLKAQINEMQFNKESIVKDIAKLLEIRDILMDD